MNYIISQVLVVLAYMFLALTYFLKNRKTILFVSLVALICNGLSYTFLNAWAGLAVIFVALCRNVIFLLQNKYRKTSKITILDYIVLFFIVMLSIFLAVVTYNGFLSLFALFASIAYTVSVWQRNNEVYKLLGILSSVLSIVYYVYIFSIFAVISEGLLLLFEISALIIYLKKQKSVIRKV